MDDKYNEVEIYWRYWGKASRNEDDGGDPYHLLVYHSLDVAAVAKSWLSSSSVLVSRLQRTTEQKPKEVIAWTLFFIGLHDLGKFDIRFQLKAIEAYQQLHDDPAFKIPDPGISRKYWHGEYAYYWVYHDLDDRFHWKPPENVWEEPEGENIWAAWSPWLSAVAGHHGKEPVEMNGTPEPMATSENIEHDKTARLQFIKALEQLFLTPAGITLNNQPPECDVLFLAGFCSVCDWLGSTTHNNNGEERFVYCSRPSDISSYFSTAKRRAKTLLEESGLLQKIKTTGGMNALFPQFKTPQQVQTLVDDLPVESGLTLIEAPTGSGKTEAALAYASYLLAQGIAESIIFALPTQATANAMLERLEEVAERMFADTNVVLAHGKARYNQRFINLQQGVINHSPQNSENELEASVHCSRWLSQSRKRVFLGQIGVCTVDQVLVSVLPVKHRFVRGFGLGKSVLIVDEVHAYDSYMYGLLNEVLQRQKTMGGSAILLSATLPLQQRQKLIHAWGGGTEVFSEDNDYPLITHLVNQQPRLFELPEEEKQRLEKLPKRMVQIQWTETSDMLPDANLQRQIIKAAEKGANVVVICNLVADAQALTLQLGSQTQIAVDIFHSRFRFKDRQIKEQTVLESYGKGDKRKSGGILVATQVVEQSLDLDFDWMITQLCPIDLLFQRLGRLHRHSRKRPDGLEQPQCVVLLPENQAYELHKLIYGNGKAPNSRVLWRTEQFIRNNTEIEFPKAYRPMIEKVYQEDAWENEPEAIALEYEKYWQENYASHLKAKMMTDVHAVWDDDDARVNLLTRDGEMSLNILPFIETFEDNCFLDESEPIKSLEEWQVLEQTMLNTIPAPASWINSGLPTEMDGTIWLMVTPDSDGWKCQTDKAIFRYNKTFGLERELT